MLKPHAVNFPGAGGGEERARAGSETSPSHLLTSAVDHCVPSSRQQQHALTLIVWAWAWESTAPQKPLKVRNYPLLQSLLVSRFCKTTLNPGQPPVAHRHHRDLMPVLCSPSTGGNNRRSVWVRGTNSLFPLDPQKYYHLYLEVFMFFTKIQYKFTFPSHHLPCP